MISPEAAALRWVRTAVGEERPDASPMLADSIARELHMIARKNEVPVEELIRWIHTEARDYSDWLKVWKEHVARYVADRARLCGGGNEPETR